MKWMVECKGAFSFILFWDIASIHEAKLGISHILQHAIFGDFKAIESGAICFQQFGCLWVGNMYIYQ